MSSPNKRKILVSGGGTGGHIYPLLEVLDHLGRRGKYEILFVGGRQNMEEEIVPSKYPFQSISVGKLRREFTLLHFRDAIRVARGITKAGLIVNKFKPNLIFCKGGYVSLPIILAGAALRIPIITHESDVVLGLTNKIALKFAKKICTGFPLRYYHNIPKNKSHYTGIPVGKDYFKQPTNADRQLFNVKKNLPVLLVTGGSQGSVTINNCLKPLLTSIAHRIQIIHITGEKWIDEFIKIKKTLPKPAKDNYHPYGFLTKSLPNAVRISTIAIGRAGGSTTAEFSAAGLPMILIPLPSSAGGHQAKNAEVYSKEGAAVVISQKYLTPERLRDVINALLDDKNRLEHLSQRAKHMSVPDSTDKIVRIIEEQLRVFR